MKNITLSLLILSLALSACQTGARHTPSIRPELWENLRQFPPLPSEAPEEWMLGHIDVESTGLIPGYNEMIDIGLIMTDLDGNVQDSLFFRIQPFFPERIAPKAQELTGFSAEKWEQMGALTPIQAVDSIRRFHYRVAQGRPTLLIANKSYFDTALLDHLFRQAGGSWRELYHYFVLDLPSIAWGLGFKDLIGQEVMIQYHIKDEPREVQEFRTGISGARRNLRIYQALVEHQRIAEWSQSPYESLEDQAASVGFTNP